MGPRRTLTWIGTVLAVTALGLVAWLLVTSWDVVRHAHPVYPALLGATAVAAVVALLLRSRGERRRSAPRTIGRVAGSVAVLVWLVALAWVRPFGPQEAARAAMASDDAVTVTEYATRIVLTPTAPGAGPALFFQPGARVDARAYVATLRPIAEAGTTVVVAKQPLGIAFLALGAFDDARSAVTSATWVVGGHSLGGTVASMTADSHDADPTAPVAGLLLWASYPASDVSDTLEAAVLSVSGSEDGLATPADIDASRPLLPADAQFVVIDGASHASFADYGPQPGDGVATLDGATARARIAAASEEFIAGLA